MDSLTHIALGAIIGEALAGKQLGKKAMIFGAVAQSIPDIDFVQSLWLSSVDNLLAHRGFTHSILFGLAISFLAGRSATRWGPPGLTSMRWSLLFGIEITVHLLLDSLNNYGIGWLEPFSHQRISFDVIFVADPFFSIWAGIGATVLLILRSHSLKRKIAWQISLAASTIYLGYSLYNKSIIEDSVRNSLDNEKIDFARLLTTPAPFNNWLWFYAVEVDSGYFAGYRSVFDRPTTNQLTFFPRQEFLLETVADQEAIGKLIRFSRGFYTVESRNDTLVFNDLRFGQVAGWSDPHAKFAFHYFVNYPDANLLVVQRGRFEHWNSKTIADFLARIRGDQHQPKVK